MAGQIWAVSSQGGYLYSRQLSNVLRMNVQPLVKFRQFADIHDISQQGKKKGDTFTWDVVSDVVTPGTVLIETNTMPETNFTMGQGTLTITEVGNSVPYSGKLDNLSKFPVEDIIKKALKNDAVKQFDRMAWAQFNTTLLRAIPTAGTATAAVTLYTNGTVTGEPGLPVRWPGLMGSATPRSIDSGGPTAFGPCDMRRGPCARIRGDRWSPSTFWAFRSAPKHSPSPSRSARLRRV